MSYFGLERPILQRKGRISWWDRGGDPAPQLGEDKTVLPQPGDGSAVADRT